MNYDTISPAGDGKVRGMIILGPRDLRGVLAIDGPTTFYYDIYVIQPRS